MDAGTVVRAPELDQPRTEIVERAGPIPALDALLAKKRHPRIAVVQGSFDWFHSGHLELVKAVAGAEVKLRGDKKARPYDLVVVLPTRPYGYAEKPFLRASYDRRVEQAAEALQAEPSLRGRAIVSDATRSVEGSPSELMNKLLELYPEARFSYCLGADSFESSKDWPGFLAMEAAGRVDLIALDRKGYALSSEERAAALIPNPNAPAISSSEIRRALGERDLSPIRGRVPPTTFAALEAELRLRTAAERSGQRLLGLDQPSYKSFEALEKARPKNAPNVLDLLDESALPEDVRQHLANVQSFINLRAKELELETFTPAAKQMKSEAGYSPKVVLEGRSGLHLAGRYLGKILDPEKAAKVEFVTVLANLFGMATPLALQHRFPTADGKGATAGVTVKLVEDVSENFELARELPQLDKKVLEYLMVSRWFNDLIGNLDCWAAQFLFPTRQDQRRAQVLHIDLDEAFDRMPRESLHFALTHHFHFDPEKIGPEHRYCGRRDRPFSFARPIDFAPHHLDTEFDVFGNLMRDYVAGRLDLDLDRIKEQVRFAGRIPRAAIQNAMQRWFGSSATPGAVHLPGLDGGPDISRADFERKFTARLEASIEQFSELLDRLKAARGNPGSPIYQELMRPPETVPGVPS